MLDTNLERPFLLSNVHLVLDTWKLSWSWHVTKASVQIMRWGAFFQPLSGGEGLFHVRHSADTATLTASDPPDTEQAPAPSPTSREALKEALVLVEGPTPTLVP